VSSDGSRLYVAESGLNAIAVIDTATFKVLGHIPTAWYPYRLGLSRDDKTLACICFKGFGNGPQGDDEPSDPYRHMGGSFHTIPIPDDLSESTATVLRDMGIVDARKDLSEMRSPVWSAYPGRASQQIKYVVFIAKENHTFDTIFDRVPGTENDPKLLRWGLDQTIAAPGQPTLHHVAVMKNHNELAREFVVSDNFYMEPEASGVGHRWLVGVQPNNWCQMLYTLGWDFDIKANAPGRLASFGGNSSMTPEDYPEAGSMWHHLARHGITFRNYGEGFEFAGGPEDAGMEESGIREVINMPMPKVLYDRTDRDFANFNLNIPDMHRYDQLRRDLGPNFINGGKDLPHFLNIALCADHGTDPNPKIGYKYMASYMADDDLALGKIIEYLSHTKYWRNMAVFVTEDDAGGENDHVDCQRSVMLIVSPWAKRGYVSHRHTTITSMHRTMYEIFGLPPLNLFDALSNDFSDCFTDKPDFRPYTAVDIDHRLFDWPKVIDPKDPDYLKAAKMPTIERDTWERDRDRD
jgi:YVTN family beta-propeller protein